MATKKKTGIKIITLTAQEACRLHAELERYDFDDADSELKFTIVKDKEEARLLVKGHSYQPEWIDEELKL